ncbi:MAG: type II toxin-antitoxin system RelE/ParE family toxin [Alphaproteobacteria bacterium]|nr:type II toxin-antitoxin system RelE/ParE family toxin [Alphaproteobacteria bacterium]
MSIQSFKHKGLQRLFTHGVQRGVPAKLARKLATLLDRLDVAEEPSDMAHPPGLRLHELKGDRKGDWSITITGNLRLTFRMSKGQVSDVDLEDYH